MKLIEKEAFGEPSAISLIIANLIPIYGVLFLGWKVADIVIFYWLETFLIGLFNVLKIIMARGEMPKTEEEAAKSMGPVMAWLQKKGKEQGGQSKTMEYEGGAGAGLRIFLAGFFMFHYNFFIFIQFTFIMIFINPGESADPFNLLGIMEFIYENTDYLFAGLLGLVLSHAHSFYLNYWKGEEYRFMNPALQMFVPYVRIFIQQFVVIFGGAIAMLFGAPVLLLVLLVAFKILVDLIAHYHSHPSIE